MQPCSSWVKELLCTLSTQLNDEKHQRFKQATEKPRSCPFFSLLLINVDQPYRKIWRLVWSEFDFCMNEPWLSLQMAYKTILYIVFWFSIILIIFTMYVFMKTVSFQIRETCSGGLFSRFLGVTRNSNEKNAERNLQLSTQRNFHLFCRLLARSFAQQH